MKAYAHPVAGQEGVWCSEPVDKSDPVDVAEPEPTKEEKAAPVIKTTTDLYKACCANFSDKFATSADVLKFIGKAQADIVDPAAEYAEIAKKLAK